LCPDAEVTVCEQLYCHKEAAWESQQVSAGFVKQGDEEDELLPTREYSFDLDSGDVGGKSDHKLLITCALHVAVKIHGLKCSCALCVRVNTITFVVFSLITAMRRYDFKACYKPNT
jgi:hypothetical protein